MSLLTRVTAIVGDFREAQSIIDEAAEVVAWREKGNAYLLAILLAEHRVRERNRVGLIRRRIIGPLTATTNRTK